MEKILEEQEKHDKMKEALEESKSKIAENEEETWKLDAKLEQLKRQEQTLNERMQRLKAQGELKEQAARAALKSAEEALEAEKARADSNKAKNEEEEREILALKKSMNRVREEHVREMEALGKKFLELRQTVRKYHGVLFEAMSQVDDEIYQLDENGNSGPGDTPMSEMSSPGGLSPAGFNI
jgi:kinetochore protein Nuf2